MLKHIHIGVGASCFFNTMQDAARDFIAFAAHGAFHSTPYIGALVTVGVVGFIYLVVSLLKIE